MNKVNKIGRVKDSHPLKRIYNNLHEYFEHQLGKEDSEKSYKGLYDQLQQSCEYFIKLLPNKNIKVLDIGARDGGATEYLNKLGYNTIGIELSQKLVEYDVGRGIPVQQGDMHHLPFEDNAFDAIFAKDVLEHSYDPHVALIEWSRVLRVGGLMYIECPCINYNYTFHSYDFTSSKMLRNIISNVLDVEVIDERKYYTVQDMYGITVRLRSKKINYYDGSNQSQTAKVILNKFKLAAKKIVGAITIKKSLGSFVFIGTANYGPLYIQALLKRTIL